MEQDVIDVVPAELKPAPRLNFDTIEQVRRSMLLTMQNMADLLGVSRVTYHNWTKGKPVKHTNAVKAKAVMRKLAAAVTIHGWPTKEAVKAPRTKRYEMLQDILKVLDEQSATQ